MRIGLLTSGGDAPGMNAAIRAVVREGLARQADMIGIRYGFAGIFDREWQPLTARSVGDIIHRGGTMLRTSRCPRMREADGPAEAAAILREAGIEHLIVIGGDGTMRAAVELAAHGIAVCGVAATIDDDVPGCDSIGFDTAVNTAVRALDAIRDTATSHERTFVVEVMGRDAGFIAVAAGIAGGAEAIMVPEIPVSLDEVAARLRRSRERGKRHSIILVAEGAGNAYTVAEALGQRLGTEIRVTVLGHLQRGGSPTATDRMLASQLGAAAVELLMAGESGVMVTLQGRQRLTVPLRQLAGRRKELAQAEYELALQLSI